MKVDTRPRLLLIYDGRPRHWLLTRIAALADLWVVSSPFPAWLRDHVGPDQVIDSDPYCTERLVQDVAAHTVRHGIEWAGVGAIGELVVPPAAAVAAALGLPGPPPGAAWRSSCNKLLMRLRCSRMGIPTPRFACLPRLERAGLTETVERVGAPCVIKPAVGHSSFGVRRIDAGDDLDLVLEALPREWSARQDEGYRAFAGAYLVEEYLPGRLVTVDGLVSNGEVHVAGMTEVCQGPEPRFVQETNVVPPRLDPSVAESCRALARRVVVVLGFDDCAFHCELRVGREGPTLVEVAARLPGGLILPAYERAHGIDMAAAQVNLWLGRPFDLTHRHRRFVYQHGVFPRTSGRIAEVTGAGKARMIEGLSDLAVLAEPGQVVSADACPPAPLFVYSVEGSSREQTLERARRLEETLLVTMESSG